MSDTIDKYQQRIIHLEAELAGFRNAVEELKVLNEIAVAAGRAVDIEQILKVILNKTINAVNAEHGAIFLVSENNQVLKTLIKQDNNINISNNYIRENITGWVLLNKQSLLIKDLGKDQRFKTNAEGEIKSLICSPIWSEGKIIGVLQMVNKKSQTPFTENELTLLSIISIQAGQLIKNSELQQLTYEKKKEAEIARLEADKLHELDTLKTNFFNNVSHEFRTPLTLIIGPAEKIISKSKDEKILKEAKIIKQNSYRLLQLINQLLDLSKIEAGKLKLEASKDNIVSFTKGVAFSFESVAESKDITMRFISSKENIELYFDKEKMLKILTNLLSNAFKFTPEEGVVTIRINEIENPPVLEIKVRDTGIGIPSEELPRLFNRFHQVESSFTKYQGTGIGLALAKELVELHRGKISVESKNGEWTEFTIVIPLGRDHLKDNEVIEDRINQPEIMIDIIPNSHTGRIEESINEVPLNKTIVLIVEDNYDMRNYIKESLQENYHIIEAVNGEQGVRRAEKVIPDLIISDLMMPKMDGGQLIKVLKNDERTSHIPIILLTAKTGQENKLEGLKFGADEYLTKPFDIKELLVRIENLISIRRILHEKFSKGRFDANLKWKKPGGIGSLKTIDEQFMNRVFSVIEENISDEDFSIEDFGSKVGMSRTQLHRKLKALTGKSASLYLRSMRLARAKEMIENGKGNISEIAYSVGFSSPAYFTRCFKEEFGDVPSNLIS